MKKIMKIAAGFSAYLALTMVMLTVNVKAYIDPSAVTYLVQAVAGAIIAIGAVITIFRHKIVAFFKKNKGEEQEDEKIEFKNAEDTANKTE